MVQLFGVDIASIVAEAIQAAGGLQAATLIQTTQGARNAANPTLQAAATTTTHTVETAIETREVRREGSTIPESVLIATLIGGSITPPTTPKVNDQLTVAGETFTLTRLRSADPAGATYIFEVVS